MVYDVVIVGGGGAGLMLARELSKQKYSILILDKNKDLLDFTFYTLASFMGVKSFGFTENVICQKINKICVKSSRFSETINGDLYTLDKKLIHEELLASLDVDNVDILKNTKVVDIHRKDNAFTSIVDDKGNEYTGKIFVDCTGTAGVLSKKVGIQSDDFGLATGVEYNVRYSGDVNKIYLLLGKQYKGGYGWIFPLKDNRGIIGFGTVDNSIKKELKKRLQEIIELPEIKKIVTLDRSKVEGGSIPITPVIEKFVLNNLVCVGDSVSQVNPIAGEGYKFVFESALLASEAIKNALENNNLSLLGTYEEKWKSRFLSNYKRSKVAQERIQGFSKSDVLVDLGVLLLKMRSDSKNLKTLSGEYY
ncbi:NAD(P)/FAD-dependent oxidoreductase [Tenacibaculum sp. MEBiC06402]|uniref:NAD(P)/FAD-dependent oxidoreductase n=1 Tax=unclassified Tenacibaculum TaxID=2635139 RepID=UPI003B9B4891